MRKLSSREALILFITLGLIVLFAVTQWVIKPLQQGGADVDIQIQRNLHQLKKARQVLLLEDKLKGRQARLVESIGYAASDASEMSAIVTKLESTAGQAGMHIANMQPQQVTTRQGMRFFPVVIEINGQWANIMQYLSLLQSAPNNYFINEMNLEKSADMTGTLTGRVIISRMRLVKP